MSGNFYLSNKNKYYLFVFQSPEPETLIPIVKVGYKVCLVGDPKQVISWNSLSRILKKFLLVGTNLLQERNGDYSL